jgi:uncharacterized protein (DUF433 family)
MKTNEIITVDPDILGGTPVFKGTRVPIKNLFDWLENGKSIEDFITDFDYIPRAHCQAILELSEKLISQININESIDR